MERLWKDEELFTKIERGTASGRFLALSDLLTNLSAKEKEMFYKTGGMQATDFRHRA